MNHQSLETIGNIADSAKDTIEFYEVFLPVAAQLCNAEFAIAWDCTKQPFRPICQHQLDSENTFRLGMPEQEHEAILNRVAGENQSVLVAPKNGKTAKGVPHLLFGTVVRKSGRELIEIVVPDGNAESDNRHALETLAKYCQVAATFEEDAHVAHDTRLEITVDELDRFSREVHSSLDFKETAANIVNEARRVLNVDRVSLILKRGKSANTIAISGQPSVNRRSNTTHLMQTLAGQVLNTGQEFWYPTDAPTPPQISKCLQNYLNVSASRSMAIVPVFSRGQDAREHPSNTQVTPKVIGGIVVENYLHEWDRDVVATAICQLSGHGSNAFRNAYQHRQLFLHPLWRTLGKSKVVVASRNLPKSILAAFIVIAIVLTACLIPARFNLNCKGVLIPEIRHHVFAEIDGQVRDLLVEHGSNVSQDQVLLRLSNQDLEFQIEQVAGKINELKNRLKSNRAVRLNRRTHSEPLPVRESSHSIGLQIESHQKVYETLMAKSQKLTVKSPISGRVISWNIVQSLQDRPVTQGNSLVEVAKVDGNWQLELDLPDRKVGHLLRARRQSTKPLDVSFKLSSDPNCIHWGKISAVSETTKVTTDQQQVVRVVVQFDHSALGDLLQARSGVTAKIDCGRRSLGYVWLHGPFEFISEWLFKTF